MTNQINKNQINYLNDLSEYLNKTLAKAGVKREDKEYKDLSDQTLELTSILLRIFSKLMVHRDITKEITLLKEFKGENIDRAYIKRAKLLFI